MTWERNDRKACRCHTSKWVDLVDGSLLCSERFFSGYPLHRYHHFHFQFFVVLQVCFIHLLLSSFCAQDISNLPSICHHSICTNNNLQQTTTITQNTLLSSQHACDKIKAYGYMEFHTTRGQTGFCSMKQEHLHCNSVQYYIVPPRGSTVDLKDQLYL